MSTQRNQDERDPLRAIFGKTRRGRETGTSCKKIHHSTDKCPERETLLRQGVLFFSEIRRTRTRPFYHSGEVCPLLVERVCFFYTCDTNLGVPSQKLRIRTTTVDIPFCSVLPSELPRAKRHGAQQRNCTGKKAFLWHLRYQSWTPFFSSKGAVLPRIEFSQVGLGQRTMAISTRSFARSSLTSGQSDPSRAGTEEPPSQQ